MIAIFFTVSFIMFSAAIWMHIKMQKRDLKKEAEKAIKELLKESKEKDCY